MKINTLLSISPVFILNFALAGCTAMMLPSSDNKMIETGKTTEFIVNADSITAYSRIKTFTQQCPNFGLNAIGPYIAHQFNLDRENSQGEIRGTIEGRPFYKIIITPHTKNSAKISMTRAKFMSAERIINNNQRYYQNIAENYRIGLGCKDNY